MVKKMKVLIRLIGNLHINNKKEIFLQISDVNKNKITLKTIIEYLKQNIPLLNTLSIEQIFNNHVFLVNEIDISVLNGLSTIIKDEDKITVLPLIHGGII